MCSTQAENSSRKLRLQVSLVSGRAHKETGNRNFREALSDSGERMELNGAAQIEETGTQPSKPVLSQLRCRVVFLVSAVLMYFCDSLASLDCTKG
jgi:hypothetical protein